MTEAANESSKGAKRREREKREKDEKTELGWCWDWRDWCSVGWLGSEKSES